MERVCVDQVVRLDPQRLLGLSRTRFGFFFQPTFVPFDWTRTKKKALNKIFPFFPYPVHSQEKKTRNKKARRQGASYRSATESEISQSPSFGGRAVESKRISPRNGTEFPDLDSLKNSKTDLVSAGYVSVLFFSFSPLPSPSEIS